MLVIDRLYEELKSSNFLVDIDSRKIRKGSIFFGIKGNNFNGNEFIKDVYLYLPYPFIVQPKGYKIKLIKFSKKERDKNLKIIQYISKEAQKRGLEFQLAIWTQRYEIDLMKNLLCFTFTKNRFKKDCSIAFFTIDGIRIKNLTQYVLTCLLLFLGE